MKKQLEKMQMPGKRKSFDLSDLGMDAGAEGSPEEEASESESEAAAEGDEGAPESEHGPSMGSEALAAASDDELLAEMKKRGLTAAMDKGEQESDQDMYS